MPVGSADDAHIHGDALFRAERLHNAVLQDAQEFCLGGQGEITYFVEKERALVGLLEDAFVVLECACESALLPAEELPLDKLGGQGRAVNFDERLVFSRACLVQGLSHQFLAHARLATEQDDGVARSHLMHLMQHVEHAF